MARCDSYIPGQCTRGACDDQGWVPDGLGNGGDWAANAPAHGLQVTLTPTAGSVVCYCPGDGYSEFGHCGVVEEVYADGSFLVKEMNFAAPFVYDFRHSSAYDVCGFILPPGVQPGQGGTSPGGGRGAVGPDGLPQELHDVWSQMTWWANQGAPTLVQQADTWRNAIRAAGGL